MLIVGRTDAKAEALILRELILRWVDEESRPLKEEGVQGPRGGERDKHFFSVFLHLSHTKALCAI